MSDYEKIVNIFIHLLNAQPSLFSREDRITLMELINNQDDDIKSLSNAISDWCAEHTKVDEALAEFEEIRGRAPGDKQVNTNIPKYKVDKKSLLNEIQQNSASTKDVEKSNGNN
ncbi:MAG: hypothetical protein RMY34_04065 [Aulosira sp. DedQUE10]|nr:hypothetical protein [Aulosira sp. DedQUE10]